MRAAVGANVELILQSWCFGSYVSFLGFLERKRLFGGNRGGAVLRGSVLCHLWCHNSQRERRSGRVHRWPTGLRVELQRGDGLLMSRRVIDNFIYAIILRLCGLSVSVWRSKWFIFIRRMIFLFIYIIITLPRPAWLYENILARTVFIKTLAFLNTCAKGT